jgi:uncharacterized protein YrrD
MFHTVKELQGYKIRATDGDIGGVHEIYFDEREWRVRYFIVNTGGLLGGRQVLISPEAVTGIDRADHTVSVNLTQQRVKDSPDITTDAPISRQHEARLAEHYGWSRYWAGGYPLRPGLMYPVGTAYGYPSTMVEIPEQPRTESNAVDREVQAEEEARKDGGSTLHSSRDVTGYRVHATDGEIGHVDDFVIDDENGFIRYIVVETGRWLSGRKVLVIPEWFESIHWEERRLYANLPRAEVANSPAYDPKELITREYETRIFENYRRPAYWEIAPSSERRDEPRS